MSLPNPGMDAVPFTPITSEWGDQIIENIEALADGSGLDDGIIDSSKVDWSVSGEIWWEELGRHTLSTTADTLTVSFTARKFIKVIAYIIGSGNVLPVLRFNNDTTDANYNRRVADNYGAGSGTAGGALFTSNGATSPQLTEAEITNVAASNKVVKGNTVTDTGDGAAPNTRQFVGQWENNADAITSIQLINGDTGDFASGSVLVILGHD